MSQTKKLNITLGFAICLISIATIAFTNLDLATSEEDFFESDMDGVWAGFFQTGGDFAFGNQPMVLNLNTQADGGKAIVHILDDPDQDVSKYDINMASNIVVKGKKLTFDLSIEDDQVSPAATELVKFTLKYKSKSNSLTGKFSSSKDFLGNGRLQLFRLESDNPFTGIWLANGKSGQIAIQMKQGSSVEGEGFVYDTFGRLRNGSVNGNKVTGTIDDGNWPYKFELTYSAAKRTLTGMFENNINVTTNEKLFAMGTNSRKMKLKKIAPSSVTVDVSTESTPSAANTLDLAMFEITLTGKNIVPGSMVHFNDRRVFIQDIEAIGKTLNLTLGILKGTVAGTSTVDVALVGPDNQIAVKKNAFTLIIENNDGGDTLEISFANDIQPIFNANCTSCHGSSGGLSLEPGVAYNNIVNVNSSTGSPYIVPGNPDGSYLLMKIRGDSGISGGRMPLGRSPLSNSDIDLIKVWIESGAPNN